MSLPNIGPIMLRLAQISESNVEPADLSTPTTIQRRSPKRESVADVEAFGGRGGIDFSFSIARQHVGHAFAQDGFDQRLRRLAVRLGASADSRTPASESQRPPG